MEHVKHSGIYKNIQVYVNTMSYFSQKTTSYDPEVNVVTVTQNAELM